MNAALSAAREHGRDVSEVPLDAIAEAAGISRSTLLRRIGGRRGALDDAVRRAGIDPGARRPVRERAIEAAAHLIAERGLAVTTLESVAEAGDCSVPSLHSIFRGRDGLLAAVFDRYSPIDELEVIAADPPEGLPAIVYRIHHAMATAFGREPRVLPALFADAFARDAGPGREAFRHAAPRLAAAITSLLGPHLRASAVESTPFPLVVQLVLGPIVAHMLLRPALISALGDRALPSIDDACETFSDAFLRAIGWPQHGQPRVLPSEILIADSDATIEAVSTHRPT